MGELKTYIYSLFILTIIFYFSCSSSSFEPKRKKDHYYINHFGKSFFKDYDIIFAKDYNGKGYYILTKILIDSLISFEYEKIRFDSLYKLEIKKIDSIVVLKAYRLQDVGDIYMDEILLWSEDTVRVPLYSVENIARTKDNVYIKKRK
ncbi:MAG: hypothetical protein ISS16_09530 [Ignavibacteria bacterium]|nr:hypothetical protein [Ignavibacteria bacterium]